MGGDDGGDRAFIARFGAVVLVVFLCVFFVGILSSTETMGFGTATITSPINVRHSLLVGRGRRPHPRKSDPIYVSKRRVPTGPDPVHNRHVGENRRPPRHV